jgi:hypothetical protein
VHGHRAQSSLVVINEGITLSRLARLKPYGRLKVTWRFTPFNLACNHHLSASLSVFLFVLNFLSSIETQQARQSWNEVRSQVKIKSRRFKEETRSKIKSKSVTTYPQTWA